MGYKVPVCEIGEGGRLVTEQGDSASVILKNIFKYFFL